MQENEDLGAEGEDLEADDGMNSAAKATKHLETLKERARTLGVVFSNNIGIDALRKKINDKMDGLKDSEIEEAVEEAKEVVVRRESKAERDQKIRTQQQAEQLAMVRCRIYNLDPSKRDLQGEILTVANKYVGTVCKLIPFGEATENGYHIEKILYEELKNRKFQQIKTKTVNGQIVVETRDVPEYNIEILAPLTADELRELALAQQAAERVGV